MYRKIPLKMGAIGLAVTSGVIAFAKIKAKTVDNEEVKSDHKLIDVNVNQLKDNNNSNAIRSEEVIKSCITRLSQWRQIHNIPGLVVGVSLKGQNVWTYCEGFADIENGVKCNDKTVMRIASISKSFTALLMAKLLQQNEIDLDKPISQYLTKDQFPDKHWEGKKVDITLRQLASHLGGIRHYKPAPPGVKPMEFASAEYYLKDEFPSVMDSLKLFKDDPLVSRPGLQYNYTTFGYTLISAVIESQLKGQKFEKYFIKFLREELGLENTYLDQNDPIIYNRSKFYRKASNGIIENTPYVDNSYKWAGGGLLSNVYDLLKFGNIMLYSYKGGIDGKPGFLKKEIVDQMWTPAENTKKKPQFGGYGLGWAAIKDESSEYAFCSEPLFDNMYSHSGGAVGATSVVIIVPKHELVVTILVNLQEATGIGGTGSYIAQQSLNTTPNWDHWAGYGLGWGVVRDVHSKYAFCSEPPFPTLASHPGRAVGASSIILVEPNHELIVAIMTNISDVSGDYGMAVEIAKQFTRRHTSCEQLDQLLTTN